MHRWRCFCSVFFLIHPPESWRRRYVTESKTVNLTRTARIDKILNLGGIGPFRVALLAVFRVLRRLELFRFYVGPIWIFYDQWYPEFRRSRNGLPRPAAATVYCIHRVMDVPGRSGFWCVVFTFATFLDSESEKSIGQTIQLGQICFVLTLLLISSFRHCSSPI